MIVHGATFNLVLIMRTARDSQVSVAARQPAPVLSITSAYSAYSGYEGLQIEPGNTAWPERMPPSVGYGRLRTGARLK